jgi:DNA-binding transcriptional regulator YiaG
VTKQRLSWDSSSVRGLRRHMELTQEQFAEALGVRQQTVSEWETGAYRPRGASGRLLTIVADRAGFVYDGGSERQVPDK